MIVYGPENILPERIKLAEELLPQVSAKHCFISGSFLYKENYQDIDIFIISRSKKSFNLENKKAKITIIDFNDLYSLFYHSVSKSCLSKNILPKRPLKVTTADYWQILNEAVPTILNQKNKYAKEVRFLVLYTEYFKNGEILDTYDLNKKINAFKDYKEVLQYIRENAPTVIKRRNKRSYLRKFFYTQAGYYQDLLKYDAQSFLYELTHLITQNG